MGVGWYNDFIFLNIIQTIFHHSLIYYKFIELVTAASSNSDEVGQTFVRIQMKLLNGRDTETIGNCDTLFLNQQIIFFITLISIVMEMPLAQFFDFLHELEKTQNEMKHNLSRV